MSNQSYTSLQRVADILARAVEEACYWQQAFERCLHPHTAWYIAAECRSLTKGLRCKLWHNQLICPLWLEKHWPVLIPRRQLAAAAAIAIAAAAIAVAIAAAIAVAAAAAAAVAAAAAAAA